MGLDELYESNSLLFQENCMHLPLSTPFSLIAPRAALSWPLSIAITGTSERAQGVLRKAPRG